jgi:hypothetical protein
MVTVCITLQLLLRSFAVTVYTPAARPVATDVVWALGVQVYENGPVPVTASVAEPVDAPLQVTLEVVTVPVIKLLAPKLAVPVTTHPPPLSLTVTV